MAKRLDLSPAAVGFSVERGELMAKEGKYFLEKSVIKFLTSYTKGDYEMLKEEDNAEVESKYENSKSEIKEIIETFREKGYEHGTSYLENITERLFTNIELWLKIGVIAPKTTSLLERVFREIGRRLKRIAWGWADKTVSNLSKMIMIRQYSEEKWEKYWEQKMGIEGYFEIKITSVELSPYEHF